MPWAAGWFRRQPCERRPARPGEPRQYLGPPLNLSFYAKILCLVLVGLNDILYFGTGLKREVDGVDAGEARLREREDRAGVSLSLWFSVIYLGVTLPFFGTGP